ncbi:AsmA family protein [Shewanella canadensis]|uniref:AsmA family protein n=1 Tax=Shewanella canadensis TaxID=271096 RepID=A0A3S0IN04_9GAMM|nr:AsmA family protein [Shewanella canadensis]RTR37955.1 AsmA family protein [Shewanella canadensis]
MKILKWLFVVFFILIISLAAYLTLVFDPNDFKPQLVDAVKENTGRNLVVADKLSWTFFPSIGIKLSKVSLSNPSGFDTSSMLEVNEIVAEVALMPLFSKQVEIAQLNVDGLTVNLETRIDGQTSFDGLEGSKSADKPAAESSAQSGKGLAGLNIGGVAITNTQIRMLDEKTGTEQLFNLEKLTLGQFALGEFAPLEYQFNAELPDMTLSSHGEGLIKVDTSMQAIELKDLKISNSVAGEGIPNKKLDISLLTQVSIALDKKRLKLSLEEFIADQIEAKGEVSVAYGGKVPNIDGQLSFGEIDLDKFMPPSDAPSQSDAKEKQATSTQEPDLSAMKLVNFKLNVTAESIKVANMLTSKWVMKLALKDGVLNLSKLNANLYKGKLSVTAQVDARQSVPSYSFEKSVEKVQIRELLKDAADVDLLAGSANFTVKGNGRSLITAKMKKNLAAKGQFEVSDGALYGVNIPQMLRDAQAKLSGDLSSTDSVEKKTDFTSLTGSFSLVNGVASNPDLLMASPLIRLSGAGTANIVTEALDYSLTTSVVGSLEGQGGGEREALHGVEIPFAISGTFSEPKFALDTAALFDAKLKQEAEKVQDKLKDSLLKKLGGF